MEFCSENMLMGGSDCEYGGPAVVQLWDIESPKTCRSFSAHDSVGYICLHVKSLYVQFLVTHFVYSILLR